LIFIVKSKSSLVTLPIEGRICWSPALMTTRDYLRKRQRHAALSLDKTDDL
jgi:hypothetical protein